MRVCPSAQLAGAGGAIGMNATVISRLTDALKGAAAGYSYAAAPAAAVLWTDKERQWSTAIGRLLPTVPQLLVLGDYPPDRRMGRTELPRRSRPQKPVTTPTGLRAELSMSQHSTG